MDFKTILHVWQAGRGHGVRRGQARRALGGALTALGVRAAHLDVDEQACQHAQIS